MGERTSIWCRTMSGGRFAVRVGDDRESLSRNSKGLKRTLNQYFLPWRELEVWMDSTYRIALSAR